MVTTSPSWNVRVGYRYTDRTVHVCAINEYGACVCSSPTRIQLHGHHTIVMGLPGVA